MTTTAATYGEQFAAALGETVRDWADQTHCPGPMIAVALGCRPGELDARLDRLTVVDVVELARLFDVSASQLVRAAEDDLR